MTSKATQRVFWQACSVSKLGNRPDENEDACLPDATRAIFEGQPEFTCALADGATRTSFSALWARLLAAAAVQRTYPDGNLAEILSAAQSQWNAELAQRSLPWHAAEKVKQGAFASLLWFGLRFKGRTARAGGTWCAVAVGDTCLFQIRAGQVLHMFPTCTAADFSRHPLLLSSVPARNSSLWNDPHNLMRADGWASGDIFLLMTDALAAWFVGEIEAGRNPLAELQENFIQAQPAEAAFSRWITALRQAGTLRNDDTTLAWISLDSPPTSRP